MYFDVEYTFMFQYWYIHAPEYYEILQYKILGCIYKDMRFMSRDNCLRIGKTPKINSSLLNQKKAYVDKQVVKNKQYTRIDNHVTNLLLIYCLFIRLKESQILG